MRLDSLTGLRGIAALLVFAYHAGGIGRFASNIFTAPGRAGVSFFFILSGFVLAWTARDDDTLGSFYVRRLARIVPLYLVACLLILASFPLTDATPTWHDVVPFALLQSWFPAEEVYFGLNPVLWSLSTEAFFYLAFPFVFPLVCHLGRRGRLLTMAVLTVAIWGVGLWAWLVGAGHDTSTWIDWAYYIFPPVRLLEFVFGIVLALHFLDGTPRRIPLWIAILVGVIAYGVAIVTPPPLRSTALTLIPFAVIIWAAAGADMRGTWSPFRQPALLALGAWSYALYLVHLRVIEVGSTRLVADVAALSRPVLALLLVGLLMVALALSWLLFRFVETPLAQRLRRAAST